MRIFFITDVSLDTKVHVEYWKSSVSEFTLAKVCTLRVLFLARLIYA